MTLSEQNAPFIHLSQRLFDTPLAIRQSKFEVTVQAIGHRLFPDFPQMAEGEAVLQEAHAAADPILDGAREADEGYTITRDGIAVIPVNGTLVKKSSWANATSGLASYQHVGRQLSAAVSSPDVRGVLLDINSPGGETHGMFDLGDYIYSLRGQKLIYAIANDAAMSAAYLLASAADRIFVTRTGAVGSIGVFSCHIDQSGADKNAGLKFTYVYAGEKKLDGNPHQPLSADAKSDFQAETDRQYGMFVDAVARNRKTSTASIEDTQAQVFSADAAVPLLADEVGSFADAYDALRDKSGIEPHRTGMAGAKAMPVIPYRKTATVRQPWSASKNRGRLRQGQPQSYYEKAHAYRDAALDPSTKSAYTFIHHEVAPNGAILSANLTACSTGIGVLNGGRGGQGRSTYTPAERRGIYRHLAQHQKDAGETPAPLKAYREYIGTRLALGLIGPALAGALRAHLSALKDSGLLAEYAFEEGDTLMARTPDTDDELLEKLAHRAETEPDDAAAEPDEDDEEEDDDKDKKRGRKGKKAKPSAASLAAAPKDDDEEDQEDEDDEEEDDDKPRRKESTAQEIMELCALAGYPHRALGFVRKGLSLAQVRTKLLELRAAKANAPERTTIGFGTVKTSALEGIMSAATGLAASKGIPIGAAYERILRANPGGYAAYVQEKLDATAAPGTSASKAYAEQIQRMLESGGPGEILLRSNVGDAVLQG